MVNKSADAFRTISEVAEWLGVQTHVLRFWESKFSQVKPVKRAGGRRYYRPADMLLLGGIRKLLHEDGMTIKGVQKILREEGMAHVADMSRPLDEVTAAQVDADLIAGGGEIEAEMATPVPDDAPEAAAVVSLDQSRSVDAPAEDQTADLFASYEPAPEASAPASDPAPEPVPDAPTAEMKTPGVYEKEKPAFPSSVEEVDATPEDLPEPAPEAPTAQMKTPGVYENEEPAFPNSVVEVDAPPTGDTPSEDLSEPAQDAAEPAPASGDDAPQQDTAPFVPDVMADAPAATDAADTPATAPAPETFEPQTADEPQETAEPASDEEPTAALPSFMRSPAAPSVPDDSAAPEEDARTPSPGGLPSFMAPPSEPETAADADTDTAPEDAAPPAAPKKPRIIDVPDAPDPATLPAAATALGLSAQATRLSAAQRAAIAPLVAELSAVRDRMADARREPR